MLKYFFTVWCPFLVICSFSISSAQQLCEQTHGVLDDQCVLQTLHKKTLETFNPKGYWPSSVDGGITYEALILAFGEHLGLLGPSLKERFQRKILDKMINDGTGWPLKPSDSEVHHTSTGLILYCLKKIGIHPHDSRVSNAWEHFRASGGVEKMGQSYLFYLKLLGLDDTFNLSAIPPLSFLKVNGPFSINDIGPMKWVVVATVIWGHLFKGHQGGPEIEIWIDRILERQGTDGLWYITNMTLINLAVLKVAQGERTVGRYEKAIRKGWQAILSLEKKNIAGEPIIQPNESTVWDTSMFLLGLMEFNAKEHRSTIKSSIDWLLKSRISYPPNWPESSIYKGSGWSFGHTHKFLSDSDDTAAVLEVFAKYVGHFPENRPQVSDQTKEALDFVFSLQNTDGGFSAFDQGVSKIPFFLAEFLFGIDDLFIDNSQIDVTGRILSSLHALEEAGLFKRKNFDSEIKRACFFIAQNPARQEYVATETGTETIKLWTGEWFEGLLYGTSEALNGLIAGNCIYGNTKKFLSGYVSWFSSIQKTDGGFGEVIKNKKSFGFNGASNIQQSIFVLKFFVKALEFHFKSEIFDQKSLIKLVSMARKLVTFVGGKATSEHISPKELAYIGVYVPGYWYVNYEALTLYGAYGTLAKWNKIKPQLEKY